MAPWCGFVSATEGHAKEGPVGEGSVERDVVGSARGHRFSRRRSIFLGEGDGGIHGGGSGGEGNQIASEDMEQGIEVLTESNVE